MYLDKINMTGNTVGKRNLSDDYTSQFSVISYTRKKVNQTRKKNNIIKLVAKRRNLKVTRSHSLGVFSFPSTAFSHKVWFQ